MSERSIGKDAEGEVDLAPHFPCHQTVRNVRVRAVVISRWAATHW
jgi:hypothetical protein